MNVAHLRNLAPAQDGFSRIHAMAVSANNRRLAVVDANRNLNMYDEAGDKKDRIPLRSGGNQTEYKTFQVVAMCFSPDSTRIAVAQSDFIIFVYRVGTEWGDRRSICAKFLQQNAITCMVWPAMTLTGLDAIVFGTEECKVKVAILNRGNKTQTVFSSDTPAECIATSPDGSQFVSAHADGTLMRNTFELEDGSVHPSGVAPGVAKLGQHSCAVTAIALGDYLAVAGSDCVIVLFDRQGHEAHKFECSAATDRVITRLAFNPSGQCLAAAMWDCLRFYDLNTRTRRWDDGAVVPMKNALQLTCLDWKSDGSRVATGTITGAVDLWDTCLRRSVLRSTFEFTYVSHNQVIVKYLKTGARIVLQSQQGFEIVKVEVRQDRYLIATTQQTLLIGDLATSLLSEIPWQLTGREHYMLDNPQVFMIYVAGELTLVQPGRNEVLGTCRTTHINQHRISVRIHDPVTSSSAALAAAAAAGRPGSAADAADGTKTAAAAAAAAAGSPTKAGAQGQGRKCIAYLIDNHTIQVDDLNRGGVADAVIQHNVKIDWLEMNHRATRLLFRDKQHRLLLFDLLNPTSPTAKVTLLEFCSYVQWVPFSDVVVAQNRGDLCVWYSIDSPDRVGITTLKSGAEVVGIERGNGKTEVLIEDGAQQAALALEEPLILYGEAMLDKDYDRAVDYLDKVKMTSAAAAASTATDSSSSSGSSKNAVRKDRLSHETEALWEHLASVTVNDRKWLHIAEKCYAALGSVSMAHALNRVRKMAKEIQAEVGGDGMDHYLVQAEMLILQKEPQRAEQIYIANGQVDKAMAMWDSLLQFDRSIALAVSNKHPDAANRRAKYFNWLVESHQEEQAAELKLDEGKHTEAINLFLRGGVPARAAQVVATHNVKLEGQVLEAIATALHRAEIYEKAGDFFEKLKLNDRALDAYKKGHVYRRAVELAKREFPGQVQALEELWGDYLAGQKQVEHAMNHYVDAKAYSKAVQAAITSRLWSKAVQLLETHMVGVENDTVVEGFYKQIALHYEEVNQLSEAEKYFVRAHAIEDAVHMYMRRNQTDHMLRVAQRHMGHDQLVQLFVEMAKQLEMKGDYAGAERIYLKVNQTQLAIQMYQKARDFGSTIRLVASYMPEHLLKFHLSLAQQFETEGNFRMAEQHCINGKEWKRAVLMYRRLNMWDDAVRVAKVHGGAEEAKTVIVERALAIEPDEAVKLLGKFGMVDAGIEAACDLERFDAAIKWCRIGSPSKVNNVYVKWAMLHEDRGQFQQAEEAFVRGQRPREAIDMYVHENMLQQAMKVAELHDPAAIPLVCNARGRQAFAQGNYKEAEEFLVRGNAPELLVRLYRENKMLRDAQRVAQDYCPELLGDITREMGLDDKDPLSAGPLLEQSGEYALAIEAYLRCNQEHTGDTAKLVQYWQRAVKLAMQFNRAMLKETSRAAVQRMVDAGCNEDAARALEDIEDYKGAITLYTRAKRFDQAESLAQRISPELVDFVKRARVQHAMESGGGADSEIKECIANNDWDKALKIARQNGPEQARIYASIYCQTMLSDMVAGSEEAAAKALKVIARDGMETADIRFFKPFTSMAFAVVAQLPNSDFEIQPLHDGIYKMVDSMANMGQPEEDIARARNALHILHAYAVQELYTRLEMPEQAAWAMLSLPRFIPAIPADKAFFDAGAAARKGGKLGIAFNFFNRFLDISDQVDEGERTSANMDHGVFEHMDYPLQFPLPQRLTVRKDLATEARDWVLARSLENDFDRTMPMVTDPNSNEPMFAAQLRSNGGNGQKFDACAVTGLPLFSGDAKTRCKGCQRAANVDAWNKLVAVSRACPWCKTTATVVLK